MSPLKQFWPSTMSIVQSSGEHSFFCIFSNPYYFGDFFIFGVLAKFCGNIIILEKLIFHIRSLFKSSIKGPQHE